MNIILTIFVILFAQYPTVRLPEFYAGEGVIFDSSANFPFRDQQYKHPYSPTIQDVKNAEQIFVEGYFRYQKKILDTFHSNYKLKHALRKPKIVKRKFKNYNRQYAGYVDTSNDTIIYIGLFNFKNKTKAEQYFSQWKKVIFLGSEGFYSKNQEHVQINISKKDFIFKIYNAQ